MRKLINEITKLFKDDSSDFKDMVILKYIGWRGDLIPSEEILKAEADEYGIENIELLKFLYTKDYYQNYLEDQHDGQIEYAREYAVYVEIEDDWEEDFEEFDDEPIKFFGKDFDLWLMKRALRDAELSTDKVNDFDKFINKMKKIPMDKINQIVDTYGIHGIKQIPAKSFQELFDSF